MRRSRLVSFLGGVLAAAFLVPSLAVAAPAAPSPAVPVAPAIEVSAPIRLGCALVVPVPLGARPAIACRWSPLEGVEVRAYRLWRSVDGRPRQLLAVVAPDARLRHADRDIARGHAYTYRVVAVGPDGARVGVSPKVTVRLGRLPEELRLRCAFLVDDERQGVACRWSASTRPAAARYVLLRSVDGGPRERIYRTGIDGRRAFLDRDVAAGQTIRYAVLARAADGRIVGIGGPVRVVVPALSAPGAR
jgi:hypothetical protein